MSCTTTVNFRGYTVTPEGTSLREEAPKEAESVEFHNYTVTNECTIEGCEHFPDRPDCLTVNLKDAFVSFQGRQDGTEVYVEHDPKDRHLNYTGPLHHISDFKDGKATIETKEGWTEVRRSHFSTIKNGKAGWQTLSDPEDKDDVEEDETVKSEGNQNGLAK